MMKKDEQQENAHKQLMEDPKYAVHVHDAQISRMAEYLEKLAERIQDDDKRIKALEDALYKLEETVRFGRPSKETDGPPELKDFIHE